MNTFSLPDVYRGFSQLLFPFRCIQCGIKILHQALPVCPVCIHNIETVNSTDVLDHIAQLSLATPPFYSAYAHWYFDHKGVVQHLHHSLKYANRPEYGVELGIMIGQGINKTAFLSQKPDWVVPIPLHKSRFLERGYNQSLMLAQGIAQAVNSPLDETILSRDLATRSQTGLNKQERRKNVHAAFSVIASPRLLNTHVLLIDDVLTTGATLFSAAQTLLQAGVSTINVATLAFTRP